MKKTTRTLKGFTLIELGVAICIVSILTSVIVPNLNENIIAANKATDLSNAKLIYEDTMIVLGTNQEAAISFYNQNCSITPQVKEPVYEWKTLPDGTKVKVFKQMKKASGKSELCPVPVVRMMGVTRSAFNTYSNAQKQYGGSGNSGTQYQSTDYHSTWEDCGSDSKNDIYQRALKANHSTEAGRKAASHSVFIKALSEKEGIPVRGQQNLNKKDPNYREVNMDKPYYPMRYCTHPRESVEGRKYTYKWIVDYDRDTMQVGVKAGWHHGDQNAIHMNCYHLYPDTCVEYRDEQFYEVK